MFYFKEHITFKNSSVNQENKKTICEIIEAVKMSIHSVERTLMQDVLEGAGRGAYYGAGLVSLFAGGAIFQSALEKGSRAFGFEPRWPFFEGDCQMERFRDSTFCTSSPLSQGSVVALISATLAGGAVVGAICGVAKNVFSRCSKAHQG